MYYYMAALDQPFFQAPDFTELEEEIEQTSQEVRDCLGPPERRKLMQLVDEQSLLRDKICLASFMAGFKLAQEIAKELEAADEYTVTAWPRTWYELCAKPDMRTAMANHYVLMIETYAIPRRGFAMGRRSTYTHATRQKQDEAAATMGSLMEQVM